MLFTVFDKSIIEASRLDLAEHGIGIRLDRKRTKLDAVIFLRCSRIDKIDRGKTGFYISTECVHRLAMFRKPVHDVAVIAGNAKFITL